MAGPSATYDILGAIDVLAPGVVVQRDVLDGCAAAYAAGGYQPLTAAQVVAVTGPLPVEPTSIPRFDRYSDDDDNGPGRLI